MDDEGMQGDGHAVDEDEKKRLKDEIKGWKNENDEGDMISYNPNDSGFTCKPLLMHEQWINN